MNIEEYIENNRLTIIVRPNSQKNRIARYDIERDALRVDIKAKPKDNKANIEVIKFFSRLTKKKVKIVSGATSKKKTLEFY